MKKLSLVLTIVAAFLFVESAVKAADIYVYNRTGSYLKVRLVSKYNREKTFLHIPNNQVRSHTFGNPRGILVGVRSIKWSGKKAKGSRWLGTDKFWVGTLTISSGKNNSHWGL